MEPRPYHETKEYADQYGVEDGEIHLGTEIMADDGHKHHHIVTELPVEMEKDYHLHNVSVCSELANIAGCNPRYTAGLSRRIAETGKKIEEVTVGELLELDRKHCEWFNSLSA